MTEDARERLRQHLIVDEGLKLSAYQDSLGYWTIGVGHLIDKRLGGSIPASIAYQLLEADIDEKVIDLVSAFPWVADLDDVRKVVLVNLCFNMGIARLSKFKNTLAAVQRGDYEAAARGLKSSRWHTQVQKSRSERLIQMMRTGKWSEVEEV